MFKERQLERKNYLNNLYHSQQNKYNMFNDYLPYYHAIKVEVPCESRKDYEQKDHLCNSLRRVSVNGY